MTGIIYLVVLFLSALGFFVSFMIHDRKTTEKPLVCPLDSNCEVVTHSEFGRIFGIDLEILGMLYYGLTFFLFSYLAFVAVSVPQLFYFAVLAMSLLAFLFSFYLVLIQFIVLREWCFWCLVSGLFCALIFFADLSLVKDFLIGMLVDYRKFILVVHVIFSAIALGAVTFSDLFFFKFLKDLRMADWEVFVLKTFSEIIWLLIPLIFITGIGLYLPMMNILNARASFVLEVVIFPIIVVNGFFLNIFVTPRLKKISFNEPHHHTIGELILLRRLSFASGAISITSWYSAFILAMINPAISFLGLLCIYLLILVLAISVSQVVLTRMH